MAEACRGRFVIAVNDAYKLFPDANILYACDGAWWDAHDGVPAFRGERWSCHGDPKHNDKRKHAEKYGLTLVQGRHAEGFSLDPALIHYGSNSGFQAINLAGHLLGWRGRIILVGFNMQPVRGKRHFFGDHPKGLIQNARYEEWVPVYGRAARSLPRGIEIINATPNSALDCFKRMTLADALALAPPCRSRDDVALAG